MLENLYYFSKITTKNYIFVTLVQDGCPLTGDASMNIRGNGDSLQGRFDIKMFKFVGDELIDVWLHCTVRACNATETGSCVPDCSNSGRKKRSGVEEENKKLNYISLDYTFVSDLPIQACFQS